jgi:hypothetical protein
MMNLKLSIIFLDTTGLNQGVTERRVTVSKNVEGKRIEWQRYNSTLPAPDSKFPNRP